VRKESKQRSNLIILPITLETNSELLLTYAITNTRAKGKGFID
jgi:hypothetical protein